MVALSRRPSSTTYSHSSSSSSLSSSSTISSPLRLILLAGSCLLLVAFADPIARDQLYADNGFVQNWVAPMPSSPMAAGGVEGKNSTQSGSSGVSADKYVVQNWSTTYKNIAIGGNDISFVADPFGVSSTPVMQLTYPKGSYTPSLGPVMGGAQFYATPFGDKSPFEKMMISYDVAFPSGFNWVLGGKLPGIYGGTPYDGCSGGIQSTGANCLTMRLMWRPSGSGEVYAYVPADANSKLCKSPEVMCNDQYGKSIGRGQIYFAAATWNRIDMIMALNEPAGNQNGTLQVYLNGNRVISMDNMPYRTTGMVGFQGLMFSSFFGGSDTSYATPIDTQVFFKNIQLSVGQPATLYEGSGGSGASRMVGIRTSGETVLWSMLAAVVLVLA